MFILLWFLALPSFASPLLLSEKNLVDLSRESSPRLSEIKANLLSSVNSRNVQMERYAPELFMKGSYLETQVQPIIEFIPVFSPVKEAHVGLRQRFKKGYDLELKLATTQQSANSRVAGKYRDVTINILSLTMQMDLWKDLFGRFSENQTTESELITRKARIEEEISRKALEISTRRLFWSLVANTEQLKISQRLLKTSEDQLKDSKVKLSKSIGDSGDVARYEAQLAERKGQAILFTYQRENLLRSLKQLLPSLNDKEFDIHQYNIDQTIESVSACAQVITGSLKVPWEYTRYDEVLSILKEQRKIHHILNDRYSDVDVKLFGTVKTTGVASELTASSARQGSYGEAFGDMSQHNRSGYEAGVNVIIPLGSAKDDTKNSKSLYDEERMKAQINGYDSQIMSTHSQLSRSLGLIGEVIQIQRYGTGALERRMKVVREKYSQARVSVNDLILDQDALLNSELSTIDSQLQAVNILFDYLMVFTDTPCEFNRI